MTAFLEADLDTITGLDALGVRLDGDLARPGDPEWDIARQAWQLAVDQRPAAVVHAASVDDVLRTVDTACQLGLRVAPQGTGHNAGPLGPLDDTILLKTSMMRGVVIDPVRKIARAEAGALWMDVVQPAYEYGLTALAGSSPDVGVVGYTVGGGISWHARSLGLAASNVVAVELVTADGTFRRVDDDHDAELFWAIRGGGGAFGIVTAIEFRLFEFTEGQAGILFFPIERAGEVLHAWREWVEDGPREGMSVGRILRSPPLPERPPFLSGQSFVVVEAVLRMAPADADRLLAPLRALGPAIDTVHPTPTSELVQLHMAPPGPVRAAGDGMLLTGLPYEAIEATLAASGPGVDSPLLSVEFRHLGGAIAPGASTGGAVTGFDAAFAMFAVGITPTPEAGVAVRAAVDAVQNRLAPWSTGHVYLNFAERHKAGSALFEADTFRRLQQVKATYDPADLIRSNHPVTPAQS